MVIGLDEKIINDTMVAFDARFKYKLRKKGNNSFNSGWEIMGKLEEEKHECVLELHNKDWSALQTELLDVAITAIWGVASLEANKGINKAAVNG